MICHNCGEVCQDLSVRDWCVNCEWRDAARNKQQLAKLKRELEDAKEALDQVPEQYRTPVRLCVECMFSEFDPLGINMRCGQKQKPRFVQPKSGDFTSGRWGYQLKCKVFAKRPSLIASEKSNEES